MSPPETRAAPPRAALGVLLLGLALTVFFWSQASRSAAQQLQRELQHDATEISQSMARHLANHELVLKGFAGLFNASTHISRSDFQRYQGAIQSDANLTQAT